MRSYSAFQAKEDVYAHYTQDDGLVSVDRDPGHWSTGNGLMHLGFFIALLDKQVLLNTKDQEHVANALTGCETETGLYNRDPGRPDLIAQDDLIGVSVASELTEGSDRTDEILSYGLRHGLFWNNTSKFTVDAFRGRSVGFMLYLLSATSKWYGRLFRPLAWLWFKRSNPIDYNAILDFMMLTVLARNSKRFTALRDSKLQKITLQVATSSYFGTKHPLGTLATLAELSS